MWHIENMQHRHSCERFHVSFFPPLPSQAASASDTFRNVGSLAFAGRLVNGATHPQGMRHNGQLWKEHPSEARRAFQTRLSLLAPYGTNRLSESEAGWIKQPFSREQTQGQKRAFSPLLSWPFSLRLPL